VGTDLVSQYQDPSRVFLVHNQEGLGPPQLSTPIQGVEANPGVVPTRNAFNLVNAFAPTPTITLQLVWNALGAALDLDIDPTSLPHRRFAALALRIGQSTEPANPAGQDQDLTLVISSGSRTAAIPASSLHRLRYPDDLTGPGKTVMQSLRLSRRRLRRLGIDVRDLRSVRLVFDRTPAGVVYVGDLQLTD